MLRLKRPTTTIRTLLFHTALLAIWFAYIASDSRLWTGRQADIDAVSSLGGIYTTDSVGDPTSRMLLGDDARFQQVKGIWLCPGIDGYDPNKIATDTEIRRVLDSTLDTSCLKTLNLYETDLTDVSLPAVTRFRLDRLNVGGTRISSDGLSLLVGMESLRDLILSNTKISDSAASHISKMTALEELELANTELTDLGLGQLDALVKLRELDVCGTAVTRDAVSAFQRASPNCEIESDFSVASPPSQTGE